MHDGLWQETVAIAEDYLSLCCSSQRRPLRAPDCVAVTMRDMIEHIDQESQDFASSLDQLLGQLGQTELDPIFVFRLVIAETSRPITWFCVINIFWTAGAFAKHLRVKRSHQDQREDDAEEEQSHDNRRLAEAIADFLAVEHRDWMLEQNGWSNFRSLYLPWIFIRHKLVIKTALYTAIGIGLTCLTLLAGRKMFTYILRVLSS